MPIPTPEKKIPTQGARVWLRRQMERAEANYKELPRWLRTDQNDPTPTRIEELETLLLQRAQEIAELQAEQSQYDRMRAGYMAKMNQELAARAQEIEQVKAALARVAELLPDPIWNARGVLIWSLLDVERVRAALVSRAPQQEPD